MDKNADLMLRINSSMLDMLRAEAKKIDASVAHVVRSMLKDALTARGHYAPTDTERATLRALASKRPRRRKVKALPTL